MDGVCLSDYKFYYQWIFENGSNEHSIVESTNACSSCSNAIHSNVMELGLVVDVYATAYFNYTQNVNDSG